MTKPETSQPEEVPVLVAQVKLEAPEPRVNGGPPQLNAITQADIDRLNADKTIEHRVMNDRGRRFEPAPSEKNNQSQAGGFAGINADLTFSRIAASPFSGCSYVRSRRTDGRG
jgi:hypothetical protein